MEIQDTGSDKLIIQHNAITSGRYDFSACELDIMFMILANLNPGEDTYSIHISDIEDITSRAWNYQQLKEATELMLSRVYQIETAEAFTQLVLFQYFDYMKGTGTVKVRLTEKAVPYFFDLKSNFTSLQLKAILSCTSKYAKRIYALACQYRVMGTKRFTIDEFKEMLYLKDPKGKAPEQFERISSLKKDVLDVAKKQINEHTDIHFDYELKKRGRSFHWIIIHVDKQKTPQLAIDFTKTLDYQRNVRAVMAYGLNEEQAEAIVKDGYDKFLTFVEDVNKKARKGEIKVENATAYIIGTYQKKGIIQKSVKA
uniref:Putative replication protein n=2 Tax=Sphingobacteriaceae TaxID=84566 RepID=B9VWK0_9SPHI|nr:replication initiation protein [Pedobacter sp. BG5]ACM47724.1 putative replication protein [Pedobacter sp. BG5]